MVSRPHHPARLIAIALVVMAGVFASGCSPARPAPRAVAAFAPLPTLAAVIPTPEPAPVWIGGALRPAPTATPTPIPTPTLDPALLPTATPLPTITPSPTPVPPPTEIPTATSVPVVEPPVRNGVNGVAYDAIVVMPPNVLARAREIYAAGQALGRNPRAFSKVGDSTIQNPHFLARFDEGTYNLGDYAYLQPVIDQFKGSFGREGAAVRLGLHSWSAVDPAWADKTVCAANETPVACEIRLNNPSVVLIRLGTNDAGVGSLFEESIRQIVDTAITAGVVPVIGTKADRHEGSNENNDVLRRIAAEYRVPLWDFDQVANTLPGRGLDEDAAHMNTFFAHDYTDPTAFTRGHAMHNLTALMALDAVWREVMNE